MPFFCHRPFTPGPLILVENTFPCVAGIDPEAQSILVDAKSFLKSSSRTFLMPLSRLLRFIMLYFLNFSMFQLQGIITSTAIALQRCWLQQQPAAMLLSPRVGSDTEGEGEGCEGDRRVMQPWFSRAMATMNWDELGNLMGLQWIESKFV